MGDLDTGGGGGVGDRFTSFWKLQSVTIKEKASCQSNRLLILLLQAETQIQILMSDKIFKMKINTYHKSPRLIPRQHLDPLYFSLQTTFNLRYV